MITKENLKPIKEKPRPGILNKPGRFRITRDLLEQNPDSVQKIMAHVIITRCEFLYEPSGHAFEYTALSNLFSEVPKGARIPEYIFKFNSNTGKFSAQVLTTDTYNTGMFLNNVPK